MKKEDVIKLESGSEIDSLIATHVMGWNLWDGEDDYNGEFPMFTVDTMGVWVRVNAEDKDGGFWFSPSKDMGNAWRVVIHLADNGFCPAILFDDNGHWSMSVEGAQSCSFGEDAMDTSTSFFIEKDMWCDTTELAICRTALIWW